MIQEAGLPPGKDPADWNLEHPDVVRAVHSAYVEAGSDIVLTNTFGATPIKYRGKYELKAVVESAIENARVGSNRVALDIGPTGRLLRPTGDLEFEEAVESFATTIRFAAGEEDLIFIETMGDVYELKAAIVAAKENSSVPIYASVALGEDGKLLTGGSVECVATLLESLRVDAYGFNCGLGPDKMIPYVERLRTVTTKPIIAKPNAGMPRVENGRTVFGVGPEEFAMHIRELIKAGASIVGGCCGTTPAYIREIAK